MPRRRYKRKRTYRRKRKRGRRRRRRGSRIITQRIRNLFQPDAMMVKLRYFTIASPTPATAVNYTTSMNSAFDPNQDGGTAQPNGFDQYALLYNRYQVLGVKCKVTVSNQSSTVSVYWCLYMREDDTVAIITPVNAIGLPYVKHRITGIISGGRPISSLTTYMTPKKFIGHATTDTLYSALVNASPIEEYYFTLSASREQTSGNVDIAIYWTNLYYVKFWDRKNPENL